MSNETDPGLLVALMERLGASPWLIEHHRLVGEAAAALIELMPCEVDGEEVLAGALIHDVGKILVPEEMSRSGARHEAAGQQLLLAHQIGPAVARHCVLHAAWDQDTDLEALLVALADKLWKGKRVTQLEDLVHAAVGKRLSTDLWEHWVMLDSGFEAIAGGGPDRLERASVHSKLAASR